MIENDINSRPFSSQVLACLPPLPWSLSLEDLANSNREDLRHLRVFSVDPPGTLSSSIFVCCYIGGYISLFVSGCKDIDDALHCKPLGNGNFEVGVRILYLVTRVKNNLP